MEFEKGIQSTRKQEPSINKETIRSEVIKFTGLMEAILKENDYKGGWKNCTDSYLIDKLLEEVCELLITFKEDYSDADFIRIFKAKLQNGRFALKSHDRREECADVANIAMMLQDEERNG